jgi:hypothetical protein
LWRWKRHRDRSRWPGRNGDSFCHIEGRFRIGYVLCISISAPLDERLGVKHGAFRTGQCDESVSRYLRRFDLMLNPTNCIWFTLCFPSGEVIVPLISKLGHHRARHSREHRMDTPDATYGIAPHFV